MALGKITLIMMITMVVLTIEIYAESSPFIICNEPLNINAPHDYFGLDMRMQTDDGGIDQLRRGSDSLTPGVYYLWPARAYSIELGSDEFYEVVDWLKASINPAYYDIYVLAHLKGFYYELQEGSTKRREYHVRFARGDTIFVISGWLGKFYCFYMSVPTDERYNIDQLQQKVKAIYPKYLPVESYLFRKQLRGNYLADYIDNNRMIRIRNFYVDEGIHLSVDNKTHVGPTYNVIEITNYINKDVMPK